MTTRVPFHGSPLLAVEGVVKRYGAFRALDGVSLTAGAGEAVALLGPNGAGKTTLLRCILGIEGYGGRIAVAGLDPLADGRAVRALVGYVPQGGGLYGDLTLRETFRFYASLRGASRAEAERRLEESGFVRLAAKRVGALSAGMRQRVAFFVALLGDPPMLLLDEPTASLDAARRAVLAHRLAELRDAGKTILLSTHSDTVLLSVAGRAVHMEEGRIVGEERFAPARPAPAREAAACAH